MTSLIDAAVEAGQPLGTLPHVKPNILICTPCHSGKVDLNYHISVTLMGANLSRAGVDYALDYNVGMTVDWARSRMASDFLKGPYTHLLFIDDDMAFAADLPYRLLCENVDVVAVPYRRKTRDVLFNVRHGIRVKTMPDRPYMVGVESIATGMMMIRRNVFEKLAPTTPDFRYDDKGETGKLFFRHQLVDDEMVGGVSYMGEDYWFCKTARDAGFDVWAYVDEEIGHIGSYAYDGKYSDHAAQGMKDNFTNGRPRLSPRVILR